MNVNEFQKAVVHTYSTTQITRYIVVARTFPLNLNI